MLVMRLALALATLLSVPAFAQTLPSGSSAGLINVRSAPYLAKGDTRSIASCTIAADSTTLNCAGANFTAADVGKRYYLQGSGTANVPQLGTIAARLSATSLTLSSPAVVATPQSGIYCSPASCPSVLAAGTGYTPGTQDLTITGGTCPTPPIIRVTVSGGGAVTAVQSIPTPGVCSVPPPSGSATTGGGGTGATFTTSGYQAAGRFYYGSDDTAAITAAIAGAAGMKLIFPAGGYWLASAAAPIALNNIAIEGTGKVGANYPFIDEGSWLLISNKASATFSGMTGVSWDGLSIFWPEQDNSAVAPVTFPALFESAQFLNTTIESARFVNGYDLFNVTAAGTGSGWGRVFIDDISAYCVNRCFTFLNGAADVLVLGPRNYFGPGAFDGGAIAGPANLGRYTAASGEFIRIDLSSGAYHSIDGINLNGFIVQGMRHGIRILNGTVGNPNTVDVSAITGMNFDAIGSVLSVEGVNSAFLSTSFTGGEIYSTSIYDQTGAPCVFCFTTASALSSFQLSGVKVQFALGSVLAVTGTGITSVTATGNDLNNFGRSTTPGTYTGLNIGVGGAGTFVAVGNTIACNRATSSGLYGLNSTGAGGYTATIAANLFKVCSFAINIAGTAGSHNVSGNSSVGTVGANSLTDASGSTALLMANANLFDKIPTSRAPTVASCAAGTVGASSSWQRGSVVIPSGTTCTINWPAALPYAPNCKPWTSNPAIVAAPTSPPSTSALVVGTSADMGGATLYWNCIL